MSKSTRRNWSFISPTTILPVLVQKVFPPRTRTRMSCPITRLNLRLNYTETWYLSVTECKPHVEPVTSHALWFFYWNEQWWFSNLNQSESSWWHFVTVPRTEFIFSVGCWLKLIGPDDSGMTVLHFVCQPSTLTTSIRLQLVSYMQCFFQSMKRSAGTNKKSCWESQEHMHMNPVCPLYFVTTSWIGNTHKCW